MLPDFPYVSIRNCKSGRSLDSRSVFDLALVLIPATVSHASQDPLVNVLDVASDLDLSAEAVPLHPIDARASKRCQPCVVTLERLSCQVCPRSGVLAVDRAIRTSVVLPVAPVRIVRGARSVPVDDLLLAVIVGFAVRMRRRSRCVDPSVHRVQPMQDRYRIVAVHGRRRRIRCRHLDSLHQTSTVGAC